MQHPFKVKNVGAVPTRSIIDKCLRDQHIGNALDFQSSEAGSIPAFRFMSDNRVHSAGKGDKARPVDYKKWSENWDRIFGKKKKKKGKKNAN